MGNLEFVMLLMLFMFRFHRFFLPRIFWWRLTEDNNGFWSSSLESFVVFGYCDVVEGYSHQNWVNFNKDPFPTQWTAGISKRIWPRIFGRQTGDDDDDFCEWSHMVLALLISSLKFVDIYFLNSIIRDVLINFTQKI